MSNSYLLSLSSVYSESFVLSPPRTIQVPDSYLSPGLATVLPALTLASCRSQSDILETEIRLRHAFVQNSMVFTTLRTKPTAFLWPGKL